MARNLSFIRCSGRSAPTERALSPSPRFAFLIPFAPRLEFRLGHANLIIASGAAISRAGKQLEQPIIEHISLGSPDYWKRFRKLPHRRPFQFFSTIPPLIMKSLSGRNEFTDEELALSKKGFYAPNADRFADLKDEIYRADTHERFDLEGFLEKMAARENIEVRIPTFGDFFRGVRKSAGIVTGKGKALTSNARADELLGDVWRKFVLATRAGKPLIIADETVAGNSMFASTTVSPPTSRRLLPL